MAGSQEQASVKEEDDQEVSFPDIDDPGKYGEDPMMVQSDHEPDQADY